MKNVAIALIVVVAVVYFIFFRGGPLKQDIPFQGQTYGYSKHMYGGSIDNHFYTPGGVDFNKATSFIQILEFDEDIPKNNWLKSLRPLLNRYKLKPVGDDELELAGRTSMSGFFYKSYAAPIMVDDKDCMAIYIVGSSEKLAEDSDDELFDILDEVKRIHLE